MKWFGIFPRRDKSSSPQATNVSLEEAFDAMEESIRTLKKNNKVIQNSVLADLEQAAKETRVIGEAKVAIVNGIVHPVTKELKRGAALGWIGLFLGVLGVLQTDLVNQQTIIAKVWSLAKSAFPQNELTEKEKSLLGDFYTSSQSVSSKAEFSAVTVRLADAMNDAEGGEAQARALLQELGKKHLQDEKNSHYLWLRNYAHVVAQWHVRKGKDSAAKMARDYVKDLREDTYYTPFLRLYAISDGPIETIGRQLPGLNALKIPSEISQLEFIGPSGRREKWGDALTCQVPADYVV